MDLEEANKGNILEEEEQTGYRMENWVRGQRPPPSPMLCYMCAGGFLALVLI